MTPAHQKPDQEQQSGFRDLGIAPKLLAAITERGFVTPTPIQRQAIPMAIEGKDIVGIAQTGTGKTLAYGVPMLQRIARLGGRGLVLLPTRELAAQVAEELHTVAGRAGLRTAVVIGGESEGRQLKQLAQRPHVIVATPGRLVDYLEHGKVTLQDVSVLILDEADRMFDMGFAPQLRKILRAIPRARQTMLFSATMPQEVIALAKEHMGMPVRVEVAPQGTTAERVEQELIIVPREQKFVLLVQILTEKPTTTIVFARTKYGASALTRKLRRAEISAVEIHGDRSQPQRTKALAGFKGGSFRVLVATDIAARGIDVKGVGLVLNYDLPGTPEDYVHRIGRTGRAGEVGHAISFATPEQAKDVQAIERLVRLQLRRRQLPADLPDAPPREHEAAHRPRTSRGEHRGPHGRPQRSRKAESSSAPQQSHGVRRGERRGSRRGGSRPSRGHSRGTPYWSPRLG